MLRTGQKLYYMDDSIQVYAPAAGGKWWLAGGISAANVYAVWKPYGASSFANGLVNIANPGTHDRTVGNAPAWGAGTGNVFDGVANYLITDSQPLTTWTIIQRVDSLAALGNNRYLFGANDGTRIYTVREGIAGTDLRYTNGNELAPVLQAPGVTSVAIAGTKAYKNGVPVPGAFTGYAGALTRSIFVGAFNNSGSAINFEKFNEYWMVVYTVQITDAQVAAVLAAAPV